MDIKLFSTAPNEKSVFWQVVLIPTITILRNKEFKDAYKVFSFEWLFWSVTILLHDN